MPRNGNGDYDLPAGNPVVPGTVIESTWANNTMNDLAAAMTDSIAADGQTTPVANLPMGGYHHTGVSDPTLRNQYATLGMSQDGRNSRIQITGGVDNLTGTLVGASTAYAAGAIMSFFAPAANTGPMTMSYNGIAAASIVTSQERPLAADDLVAGGNYLIQYTGLAFKLLTPVRSQSGAVYAQSAVTGWVRPDDGVYPPVTLASGTTINVPAGRGVIVPPGNDGADEALSVEWVAQSVTLSYLTSSFSTAVAINAQGTVTQFAGRIPSNSERDYILLAIVNHVNGTATKVTTTPSIFGDNGYLGTDVANMLTNMLTSGGRVTANGVNLLINVSNGLISQPGGNYTDKNLPNRLTLTGGTGVSFRTLAGQGTLGAVTNTAPVTSYDPNGSGVVTALPANSDCTIHRLYYLFGEFVWVYGQQVYASISSALTYLDVDRTKYIPSLKLSDATLIAEILSTKSNTDLSSVNAAFISYGGSNISIGSSGGIGEAPVDGLTYGRKNATWAATISAATPNLTGDVVITKTAPKVIETFNPVAAGYAGLNVKQLTFNWANIEVTHPDDKTYFRSYNPATGVLRNTTTWDLANGNWTFPGNITAGTINGAPLPVFGTAATANVTTSPTDTTSGRVWRNNDMVKQTGVTDATAGSVLLVGAGGLLGNAPFAPNADNVAVTQFNNVTAGTTNIPVAETGTLFTIIDGNNGTQTYQSITSGVVYKRSRLASNWGTWSKWIEIGSTPYFVNVKDKYTDKGNVAGAVSIDPTVDGGDVQFNMTTNTTVSFTTTGIAIGESVICSVQVSGAFVITWPAGIFWPTGGVPAYTSPSIYTFQMRNKAGTVQIFGFQSGAGMVAV